jgi:prepilin-type N-terminal cleavage/methylation domain-containing protein
MTLVRREKNKEHGFTLIEVIIAVLILGVSLTTIVGLQSSILSQAVRDRNKTYALFAARSVLTELELGAAQLEPATKNDKLTEFLQASGGYKKTDQLFLDAVKDFDATILIDELEVPNPGPATMSQSGTAIPAPALKFIKIILTISWGEASIDSITIPLILPKQ